MTSPELENAVKDVLGTRAWGMVVDIMADWHDTTSYTPLLPPGMHPTIMTELYNLCVIGFPLSNTRAMIMRGLLALINELRDAGVEGELWIDGSFVTKKIDPNDVDIVLRLDSAFVESPTDAQAAVIGAVIANQRDTRLCDSYCFVEFPPGHEHFELGQEQRAYWLDLWGRDRQQKPKGFAVVALVTGGQ